MRCSMDRGIKTVDIYLYVCDMCVCFNAGKIPSLPTGLVGVNIEKIDAASKLKRFDSS